MEDYKTFAYPTDTHTHTTREVRPSVDSSLTVPTASTRHVSNAEVTYPPTRGTQQVKGRGLIDYRKGF